MRKLLIICWTLYFSATCKQVNPTPEITVVKATMQSWGGGAAGSGHGINYNFYCIVTGQAVLFDSVWVDGYALPVHSQIKKDTLQLTAQAYFRGQIGMNTSNSIGPKEEAQPAMSTDKAVKNPPAVLSYRFNDKTLLIGVPKIDRLKPLSYP